MVPRLSKLGGDRRQNEWQIELVFNLDCELSLGLVLVVQRKRVRRRMGENPVIAISGRVKDSCVTVRLWTDV